MKQPFSVQLRRYEVVGGIIWLLVYLLWMGGGLSWGLGLLGLHPDSMSLQKIYYLGCFLVTVVLFRRFLSYSLPLVAERPIRVLGGMLLGYCIYSASQVTLNVVFGALVPGLQTPNDDSIRAVASGSFSTMAVAAVLLTPITEETLLRGLVFGTLRKYSRIAAYLLTMLLFSGIHVVNFVTQLDPVSLVLNLTIYLLPGMAMCMCYEYAGTIWAPIALHALINGLAMWAMQMGY